MTTTSQTQQTSPETPIAVPIAAPAKPSLARIIQSIAQTRSSDQVAYCNDCFYAIADRMDAQWANLDVQIGGRSIQREFHGIDLDGCNIAMIADEVASKTRIDNTITSWLIEHAGQHFGFFSFPIHEQGESTNIGSITMVLQLPDPSTEESVKSSITQISDLLSQNFPAFGQHGNTADDSEEKKIDSVIKASNFTTLRELCYELTNAFCSKLECQQVSMGMVQRGRVKMLAVSGLDLITENSPAIIEIRQAMEECLDHGKRIVVQHARDENHVPADSFLLHRDWHNQSGGTAVCSIPLKQDGKTVAVFSLQRRLEDPFTHTNLAKTEETLESFVPAIELLKKADRNLRTHAKQSFHEQVIGTFTGKNLKKKTVGFCLLGMIAWFVLGWMPFRPTVPCSVQPAQMQHLVAPFDGTIANVHFVPGDEVKLGDVILEFDLKQLELEKISLQKQVQGKQIARDLAIVENKMVNAAVLDAELSLLNTRIEQVTRRLDMGVVKAEFDGIVFAGDLRAEIGQVVPTGKPLMKIAPSKNKLIRLEIPQNLAAHINKGDRGSFAPGSQPGKRISCRITQVTPSVSPVNGRSVLLAEAELDSTSAHVVGGIEGVARINTGWQPVWWITSRKLIDGLRMGFWL